jgi:hypothetical protein
VNLIIYAAIGINNFPTDNPTVYRAWENNVFVKVNVLILTLKQIFDEQYVSHIGLSFPQLAHVNLTSVCHKLKDKKQTFSKHDRKVS